MKKSGLFLIMAILCLVFVSVAVADSNSTTDKTDSKNIVEKQKTDSDNNIAKEENNVSQDTSDKETKEIARSGCCSWHNGVCGCDQNSGMMRCCDGTLSPSCTCAGY